MARIIDPPPEAEQEWKDWVAELPPDERAVAERFDVFSLYRMKSTGHRVTLLSFGTGEDGKVVLRVLVSGQFNLISMERQVYGVDPDDLEPCDLPGNDEPLGVICRSEEEKSALIQGIKDGKGPRDVDVIKRGVRRLAAERNHRAKP